jgi:hypothetical protein
VARYEELRQQALGKWERGWGGRGFALFLRQGMKGWMEAWSRCVPEIPPRPLRGCSREEVVPLDLRAEVVMVLTGMVLREGQEVRR